MKEEGGMRGDGGAGAEGDCLPPVGLDCIEGVCVHVFVCVCARVCVLPVHGRA